MSKPILDKEVKKTILNARALVEEISKLDSNEAETRKRIDHMLEKLMGYNTFQHITQEYAIYSSGDNVYCDIAIRLDRNEKPQIIVEAKRVNSELSSKHLRQAASYAIDIGCEWIILTNSRIWNLYHITYGQPPQTKLIESWDLINDELHVLAEKFELVSFKSVKKKSLRTLWDKCNVLNPENMLKSILSEEALRLYRRNIKSIGDINVPPEDIVAAIRSLLNETALAEMEKIKISLPEKKHQKPAIKQPPTAIEKEAEAILAKKQAENK